MIFSLATYYLNVSLNTSFYTDSLLPAWSIDNCCAKQIATADYPDYVPVECSVAEWWRHGPRDREVEGSNPGLGINLLPLFPSLSIADSVPSLWDQTRTLGPVQSWCALVTQLIARRCPSICFNSQ